MVFRSAAEVAQCENHGGRFKKPRAGGALDLDQQHSTEVAVVQGELEAGTAALLLARGVDRITQARIVVSPSCSPRQGAIELRSISNSREAKTMPLASVAGRKGSHGLDRSIARRPNSDTLRRTWLRTSDETGLCRSRSSAWVKAWNERKQEKRRLLSRLCPARSHPKEVSSSREALAPPMRYVEARSRSHKRSPQRRSTRPRPRARAEGWRSKGWSEFPWCCRQAHSVSSAERGGSERAAVPGQCL